MNEDQVREAYQKYGFTQVRLLGQSKGYRNTSYIAKADHKALNLILYKDEPAIGARIRRANALGDFVANSGIPARHTADARILRLDSETRTRYAALYHYLPGETIAWEAYTQKHIKLLGMTLAKFHLNSRSFNASNFPNVSDEYIEICTRMQIYFSDSPAMQAAAKHLGICIDRARIEQLIALLQACKQLPDMQVLHMDFVRSNVLFKAGKRGPFRVEDIMMSGILDFEKAAYGHRIFDIARTLAFLLVDSKHKTDDKVRKYFIYSGYIKRGEQTLPRISMTIHGIKYDVLEELLSLFLLYDVYKFMRHNPYETLNQNEHYVRTRDMLFTRKVLART